jgi:hypothetical protein
LISSDQQDWAANTHIFGPACSIRLLSMEKRQAEEMGFFLFFVISFTRNAEESFEAMLLKI